MPSSDELRPGVALVVNDMINSNVHSGDPAHDGPIARSGLVAEVAGLVAACRAAAVPIFWIRVVRRADRADVVATRVDRLHRDVPVPRPPVLAGSTAGANVDELPVRDGDHEVYKPRMDPFVGTELDLHLRSRGVRTVLVAGYATNGGVESAVRTGNDLGYDMVTVSDCCFNVRVDRHEFALEHVLPYLCRVRTRAEVQRMLPAVPTRSGVAPIG